MKLITLLITLSAFIFASCQSKNAATDLSEMEWLIGTWKGEASGQPFYEKWTKVSDKEFSNINFGISGTDTLVGGRAKIAFIQDKIAYAGEDRTLELTSLTNNKAVFENKEKGEKFTFSLNEKQEWVAFLQYPTTQVEYTLIKISE